MSSLATGNMDDQNHTQNATASTIATTTATTATTTTETTIDVEELLKRNASLENQVKDLQRQLREFKSGKIYFMSTKVKENLRKYRAFYENNGNKIPKQDGDGEEKRLYKFRQRAKNQPDCHHWCKEPSLTSNRPTIETILGSELTEIFLANNSTVGLKGWKARVANWVVEVEKNRESTGETKNNLSLFPSQHSQNEAQCLAAEDRNYLIAMLDGRRENPNNITWDMIKSWVNDDVLFQEFKIHDNENHPHWQRVVTEMKPVESTTKLTRLKKPRMKIKIKPLPSNSHHWSKHKITNDVSEDEEEEDESNEDEEK